jgi:multidrug efflux system membrane fusion protein
MAALRRFHHRVFLPSILLCFLLLPSLLLLPSCSGTTTAADSPPAGRGGGRGGRGGDAARVVPVSTARATEKAVPLEVTTVGTAEAYSTVDVRSQVTGLLTTVEFAEGDDVTQGQLLFTIDARPFEVAVRQAEATRDRDTAQANNAEAIRVRNASLLKGGLMSQADYDLSSTSSAALKAAVAADAAAVDNARLQLQYTKITAPVSGRTGALLVHQGSLVRNADTSPLVVINQLAPIRMTFAVPGQFLTQIREGQARAPLAVTARTSGEQGRASTGTVSFIDNAADPSTGTIRLKATFPNVDHRLWPGDLVQATLQLAIDPHAVVVPSAAVQNGQQGQFVFVVAEDRTVALRPVKVSRTNGDDAVVAAGLRVGEEVVTDGQLLLTPGARISVKPAAGGRGAP